MNAGTRALVRMLAEQIAAEHLAAERARLAPASTEVDHDQEREHNAHRTTEEQA